MRSPALHLAALVLLGTLALGVGPATVAADAENVSLYGVSDPADAEAAAAAVEDGTAASGDVVVAGEGLVVVVDSERLADDLEARNGSTTERFFAALEDDADFRMVQTEPASGDARKVAALDPGNATVHRNGSTVYVLVDVGNTSFERPASDDAGATSLRDGERYAVTVGYDLAADATDGPEVELYTTYSEFNTASTNWFDPLPPEEVRRGVTVNVEPESEHLARLTLEDGHTVTGHVSPVEWSGKPGVVLDLRDVEPGTAYVLELVHDGRVVDRHEGTVREPSATVTDETVTEVDGWTAVNATANLSHGGEIRIVNEFGDRLGWSAVPPGEETHVSIRLRGEAEELIVKPARESGAAETFYAGSWTTIDLEDRELRNPLDTPNETDDRAGDAADDGADDGTDDEADTDDEARTGTTTATGTATATETDGDGGSEDQPGFGFGVAVPALAIATLVGSAILARRRA